MIERWIVAQRRATCLACAQAAACEAAPGILPSLFAETTRCPLALHPSRDEAIAARAWPADAPPVSGCCDPPPL
jgi:hypothetical protein